MSRPGSAGRVLVIVTGGIAAYKCADVVRRLRKAGKEVRVVMTAAATSFVGPLTFQTLSGNAVGLDMFGDRRPLDPLEHITFARWGDIVLVCPATANFLAKMAHGLADDLASATVLASRAPVIACPAMNDGMWDNPATCANIEVLKSRGVNLVGPVTGSLACDTEGMGRMVEPKIIVDELVNALDGGHAG
ncbi:MAG TPA: flavoprotein [Candidatus Ozemobacteraceae bacterium]|nr:flavoprotein [Candidatus Ozemobacteraceae bacterium]